MLKKLTRLAPVFLIILLPWFFYWFLSGGKHKAKPIGFYGPKNPVTKTVNGIEITDTVYHTINNFTLTDVNGRTYSDAELAKYFHVIGVFNTGSNVSLALFEKLFFLQEELKGKSDVRILTITNQPSADSLEAIRKFIGGKIIDMGKWYFLKGNESETEELLTKSLFLTYSNDKPTGNDQLFLIDKDKRIRGIYDGTDEVDLKRLFDEVKVLRLEYALKNQK